MENQTKENAGGDLGINEALGVLSRELGGKRDEINRLISEKYSNLKGMMEETKGNVKETVAKGQEKAREMASEVDKRVHTNPWLAVGIAAASGFFLGYLMENRRSE